MLAYYLHDLSPDIIRFGNGVAWRWYGLAYVWGFFLCWLIMTALARRGYGELKPEQTGGFILSGAFFGVLLGGRLGYILFYKLDLYLVHPLEALKLWHGGMSAHGAFLGLFFFTLGYARWKKISWPGLSDNLVVGSSIGIFFGRMANFINGELWGRPTDVKWAVKFPMELFVARVPPSEFGIEVPGDQFPRHSNEIIALARQFPGALERIAAALPPRHPSQVYEALMEGLLTFAVLLFLRLRSKNLPHGLLTGLFFVIYGAVRIIGETFREPDATLIMGITRGQFYSVFMILIGAGFLAHARWRARLRAQPDQGM